MRQTPFEDLKYWLRLILSNGGRKYQSDYVKNAVCQWLSYVLPKRLIFFCHIQVLAEMTTGEYSNVNVVELSAMDALKNFSKKHNL